MDYSANYINKDVLKLYKKENFFIKYPGSICDFENMEYLCSTDFKILLHGIPACSGSLFDPHLLDNFDAFKKYAKSTHQRWLSFHLNYKFKFGSRDEVISTFESNLKKIRDEFGNLPILIENMPNCEDYYFFSPNTINEFLEKYDLKLLFDISHCNVASQKLGITFEQYVDILDIDKTVEIHLSGVGIENGVYFDKHGKANELEYNSLRYILPKCPNLKMISIEFSPLTCGDYNSASLKQMNDDRLEQLNKVKQIYTEFETSNKTK